MRTFALTLSALVLLAGCISGDEPVESADIQAPPGADAPAAASTSAEATAESAAAPAPVSAAFPFSFEGKTGTWVCAPDGPNSCRGLPVGSDSSNTFAPLEYEGTAEAADVTLTWSAATPATSEMYLVLFAIRSCGDGCFEWDSDTYFQGIMGPSPLTLSASDIKLGANETLYLHVSTVDMTPPLPVVYGYSLEQAFSVEGTVSALVPPRA